MMIYDPNEDKMSWKIKHNRSPYANNPAGRAAEKREKDELEMAREKRERQVKDGNSL